MLPFAAAVGGGVQQPAAAVVGGTVQQTVAPLVGVGLQQSAAAAVGLAVQQQAIFEHLQVGSPFRYRFGWILLRGGLRETFRAESCSNFKCCLEFVLFDYTF